ncbi:hypothetical protein F2Q68_00010464 [Brassica cretica]|uniref:Uncharacterized protein n=1 Tax=Brassica cretica TaxID=69181 RepID=A0A3N6R528_BRACR|nr:hypothetical protein F2Q68_00010464 [Brassica cretica]
MFNPVEVFLFFRHRFIERRAFPSRSASGSSWMYVSVIFRIVGNIAGIQVDMLGFIDLCVPCGRPVEWSCEVEFSSADFCRSAREECTGSCR